jgi:hypothetical protein
MPDFGDLEKEAESHSPQVDEGIQKAEQAGDKELDGRDHGMLDKGGAELEKEIGQQ